MSQAPAAPPQSTRKRSKRKAEPEAAASTPKKACTIADGPKVGLPCFLLDCYPVTLSGLLHSTVYAQEGNLPVADELCFLCLERTGGLQPVTVSLPEVA